MTDFDAIGKAEGFIEVESLEDQLEAWAHIARTGLYRSLQGFFGRQIRDLVDQGIMDWGGNIDWDVVDELSN